MKKKNRMLVAIAALLMMGAVSRPGFAQAQQIGVVDMDKLAQNYKRYTEADARIKTQIQTLDTQLKSRKFLDATEGPRFDTLIVNQSRSKVDEDAFQVLVKAGFDRNAELTDLNSKPTRNDAENARMKVLNDQGEANVAAMQAISDKVFSDMQNAMKTQEDDITKQFKDTIAKVAADRKLLLVVDTQFSLWNSPGADITDEVLKRLNK